MIIFPDQSKWIGSKNQKITLKKMSTINTINHNNIVSHCFSDRYSIHTNNNYIALIFNLKRTL